MLTLLLAVGALFLSYLINKILLGLLRERAIIFAAPPNRGASKNNTGLYLK